MAMQKKSEHGFNRIIKDIKSGKIGNLVLLYGKEKFLIDWSKNQLISNFTQRAVRTFDVINMDGKDFEFDELVAGCETLPIFSERKVVVLENFPKIVKGFNPDKNNDDKKFLEYINNLPVTSLLIVTGDGTEQDDKRSSSNRLIKECKKIGNCYEFTSLSERDLIKFANKRFHVEGKKISKNVMNMLIFNSGYSSKDIDYALYNFENDIKKIIALSPGEIITEDAVIKGISDNLEYNVFKMLDSISANKKDRAFIMLNDMILSGGNEYQILAIIAWQFELLLQVKELKNMGMSPGDIAKKLKIHIFRVEKAYKFVTNFTEKDLRRILIVIFETDYHIKSGTLTPQLALELLIAEI